MQQFAVTDDFLREFGKLVHLFAQLEVQMKFFLCGLLEMPMHEIILLTDPAPSQRFSTILTSVGALKLGEDDWNELKTIVDEIEPYRALRNDVAHSFWANGTRDDSIRPVKMKTQRGRPNPVGFDENERDYKLEDFQAVSERLIETGQKLVKLSELTGTWASVEKLHDFGGETE